MDFAERKTEGERESIARTEPSIAKSLPLRRGGLRYLALMCIDALCVQRLPQSPSVIRRWRLPPPSRREAHVTSPLRKGGFALSPTTAEQFLHRVPAQRVPFSLTGRNIERAKCQYLFTKKDRENFPVLWNFAFNLTRVGTYRAGRGLHAIASDGLHTVTG